GCTWQQAADGTAAARPWGPRGRPYGVQVRLFLEHPRPCRDRVGSHWAPRARPMKLLSTILLATLAALTMYAARRRILFALKTGAVVYVVVLFVRLILSAGSLAERWEDLLWPVLIMLVAWVGLWWATNVYAARKSRRPR